MRGRVELAGVLILAGKRLRVKDEERGPTHKAGVSLAAMDWDDSRVLKQVSLMATL